jgi:hypothetical protein
LFLEGGEVGVAQGCRRREFIKSELQRGLRRGGEVD